MEIGQYPLQIFVSLVVILGAAFVALICDFLKGNNEQLRELNVELRVRREEEQRSARVLAARSRETAAATAAMQRAAAAQSSKERAEKLAEAPAAHPAPRPMATPQENKRAAAPEAMAAMERGAQLAGTPQTTTLQPTPARRADPVPVPAAAAPISETAPKLVLKPIAVASRPSVATDWNTLLSRGAASGKSAQEASVAAPVVEVAAPVQASPLDAFVPAGFHEGFVLSQLVKSHQPVTGLVVSIGVNTEREADGSLPGNVLNLIQSLIGPDDFACQSSPEEFLLIYPRERGASAQRRLSQIAEQLWNFQLGSMGTFSILFSWGGVEVARESIDEALESANERMQDTWRGRSKLLTMESRRGNAPLRKAV
jgi:hypothetical protein